MIKDLPLKHSGMILWLTGLSGAGKTTLAQQLEYNLRESDRPVELLDGDVIRQNLSKGLGFSREDRDINVCRVGYVANLLSRNGVITIVSLISPYRTVRDELRSTLNNFVEIYVNAPLEVCEARDVKGLYAKARSGKIKSFTGIDDPYEAPLNPDITCYTAKETVDESVTKIVTWLEKVGYLQGSKTRIPRGDRTFQSTYIMKLFLIASECPPVPGGIATYVGNTAAMFADAGHYITIFARSPQPGIEQQGHCTFIKIAPKDVHLLSPTPAHPFSETHPAFPYNVMGYWGALSYQLAETVINYIREHGKPDAIESEDFSGIAYFLIQQKLLGCPELEGVPILLTLHSSQYMLYPASRMPSYRLSDYWVGRMEKFCTLAADGIIAPTQYIASQAIAELGSGLDIEIIPLPASKQLLDENRLPHTQPEAGDIVYFGRLEVRKGILPLVEACSRLWDAGVDFRLTAIGGDTWYHLQGCHMKVYLQQKYHRYIETGKFILSPPLVQSQLYERIAKAWCVVIPSLWENFPNTCLESLLLGKVILASSGVGHVEMLRTVKGEAGILFDWQVSGDFECQLKRILAFSSEEILQAGQQARNLILDLAGHQQVLSQRLKHLEKFIQRDYPEGKLCQGDYKRRLFPSLNYPPHGHISYPQVSTNDAGIRGRVSVCIPFYNHGQFVEEALESVNASDYEDIEVILIDDGSTDPQSLTKLASVQNRYPNLKVMQTPNQGVAAARNQMVAKSSGEYIAFLDADDQVSSTFYTQAVKVLDQYENVGFVASWLKEFGSSQKVWIAWNPEFPYLLCHNMLGVCTVVRKSAYLAIGGMKSVLAENLEDYECWISLCERGWVGVVIPELHYFYRIRPTSRLGNSNRDQLLYLYEAISSLHPDLYGKYGDEIYHLLNQNGASWLWDNPSRNAAISTTDLTGMEILMLLVRKLQRMHSDGGGALIFRRGVILVRAMLDNFTTRFSKNVD